MKRISFLIAALTLAACDPGDPLASSGDDGGSGGPESSSTSGPSTTGESGKDPSGAADETGDPADPLCPPGFECCDAHRFRLASPKGVPVAFPMGEKPLGPEWESIDVKMECDTIAPGDTGFPGPRVDVSGAQFELNPAFTIYTSDLVPTPTQGSLQEIGQLAQELYGCEPISDDPGSVEWKLLAGRIESAFVDECSATLADEYGCVQGSIYTLGQGARDICTWWLGRHLELTFEASTYQITHAGTTMIAQEAGSFVCDTKPEVDESCGAGADGSSGG